MLCERQERHDPVETAVERNHLRRHALEVALPQGLDLLVHQLLLHPRQIRVMQLALVDAGAVLVRELHNLLLAEVGHADEDGLGAVDLVPGRAGLAALVREGAVLPRLQERLVHLLRLVPAEGAGEVLELLELVEHHHRPLRLAGAEEGDEGAVGGVLPPGGAPQAAAEEVCVVAQRAAYDVEDVILGHERAGEAHGGEGLAVAGRPGQQQHEGLPPRRPRVRAVPQHPLEEDPGREPLADDAEVDLEEPLQPEGPQLVLLLLGDGVQRGLVQPVLHRDVDVGGAHHVAHALVARALGQEQAGHLRAVVVGVEDGRLEGGVPAGHHEVDVGAQVDQVPHDAVVVLVDGVRERRPAGPLAEAVHLRAPPDQRLKLGARLLLDHAEDEDVVELGAGSRKGRWGGLLLRARFLSCCWMDYRHQDSDIPPCSRFHRLVRVSPRHR
mmetsp:Transcript_17322/g.36595  ORF Transcript_17322/g.36595 Transcript_17322/m.36595 type:complete len:441 (-) Transcript_17322:261-1583(-)